MGIVITFSNQKGGVAKTTSAVSTAAYLHTHNQRVLLVDADPQGSATKMTLGEKPNDKTLFTVLNQLCPVVDAIRHAEDFGDVLAGSRMLYDESALADNGFLLRNIIDSIRDNYDFIIIDTPPNLSLCQSAALVASDYVVMPTKATGGSIDGVGELIDTIAKIQQYNPNLRIAGFLITMSSKRVRAVKQVSEYLKDYAKEIGCVVFDSQIRTAEGLFGEAELFHDTIFTLKAKNNATKDYRAFVEQLLEVMGCVKK